MGYSKFKIAQKTKARKVSREAILNNLNLHLGVDEKIKTDPVMYTIFNMAFNQGYKVGWREAKRCDRRNERMEEKNEKCEKCGHDSWFDNDFAGPKCDCECHK